MTDPTPADVGQAKAELRRTMRRRRLEVADDAFSARICQTLQELVATTSASLVMVYDPVPGEPDLQEFVRWCELHAIRTVAPSATPRASDPADPTEVDVVIVPGLAFTVDGQRLGQGGGWYDRLLVRVRRDCLTVGLGFELQVVETLPTEPHDVALDVIVTELGLIDARR